MNDNQQNQSIEQQAQQLPEELSPKRDLWPGIEQALNQAQQETKTTAWPAWQKVAAVFAPVVLVFGLWNNSSSQAGNLEWLTPVAASFELQKQTLLQQVSGRTPLIDDYQASMAELEQAEQALKKALQSQPEDPALMKMLNQVYQQQLSLINKAHQPKFTQI